MLFFDRHQKSNKSSTELPSKKTTSKDISFLKSTSAHWSAWKQVIYLWKKGFCFILPFERAFKEKAKVLCLQLVKTWKTMETSWQNFTPHLCHLPTPLVLSAPFKAPFTSDVENLKAAKHSCYFFLSTLFLSKPSTKRKKAWGTDLPAWLIQWLAFRTETELTALLLLEQHYPHYQGVLLHFLNPHYKKIVLRENPPRSELLEKPI